MRSRIGKLVLMNTQHNVIACSIKNAQARFHIIVLAFFDIVSFCRQVAVVSSCHLRFKTEEAQQIVYICCAFIMPNRTVKRHLLRQRFTAGGAFYNFGLTGSDKAALHM